MSFRDQLLATLRAMQPVLSVPGVLVIGSEVPNLLEKGAASTLVVSEDVDIGIPIANHAAVVERLVDVRGLHPSLSEPSVWVPDTADLIEVNFVGMDASADLSEPARVFEDPKLPLLVFAYLSFLREGRTLDVDGIRVPTPKPAGLMLEKLVTERSGIKGDRDLMVVLGLLITASSEDILELQAQAGALPADLQQAVLSNLTVMSLMEPVADMPDPTKHRELIHHLLQLLERLGATE
jgi:hypothetical protein